MGWSVGYDTNWNRDVGYGVPATCDHPGCHEEIDRGLAYVCGGDIYGGDHGCGLFFCYNHTFYAADRPPMVCERCLHGDPPFEPSPDTQEWIDHKNTHPSWAGWRSEQNQ